MDLEKTESQVETKRKRNFIKRNFFKISTILLLAVVVLLLIVGSKITKVEHLISLPPYSYSDLKEYGYDYISVSGTLTSLSADGIGSGLNTVQFVCDLVESKCTLNQAELFDDSFLTQSSETFVLTGWDDNYVTFETLPENQKCVVWKYRIDRFKKELIGKREQSNNYDYSTCMGIGLQDFSVMVSDGWGVVSKLRGY